MIEELAAEIRGEVLRAGAAFDESRTVWNGMIDTHPAVVVRPASSADVVAAVRHAGRHGLRVAAKGGGHNVAGRAVPDGGMLIDLCRLDELRVDPRRQVGHVGGGVRLAALDRETQAFGLATPAGVHSGTGIAGLTLGGGVGWLSRRFGLASDNLIAADVVTADGRLVRASKKENEDLFWALRGGGPGFGIVTTFEFQLHEVGPDVMMAQAYHPLDDLASVMGHHRSLVEGAPDEFSCYLMVIKAPPAAPFPEDRWGEPVVALVSCDTGPTGDARDRADAVTSAGDPFVSVAEPTPYTALQAAFDAGSPDGARYYFKSHMLRDLGGGFDDTLVRAIGSIPGELSMVAIEPLGGAIARVGGDATAWPHRDAVANFGVFAGWTDPGDDAEIQQWARSVHAAVSPHSTGHAYFNYLDRDDGDIAATAFGSHAQRLAEVQRRWDPDGLFAAS